MHTYIHNWPLQPFSQINDLVSHTTYMVCVLILYISGETCSLKSTPTDRLFEELYMSILFTLRVFARNLLRINRILFNFVFYFDIWPMARTLALHLISQHTTIILVLISYSNYSYSKFEVLTVVILNNTHDVVDFDSS